MKTMKRITALLLLLCMVLPLPALAAPASAQPVDELQAAQQLAAVLRQGGTEITVRVSAAFDYKLCLEYSRMLYPDYYGMAWSWNPHAQTAVLRAEMAEPEKHNQAWNEAKRVAASMQGRGLSETELLRAFHDYLIENCTYDFDTYRNMSIAGPEPFSAYGALLGGKGVCDSYSAAFAMLCAAADIPCIYVGSDELNHSWNAVFSGGRVYFIDVTYDDADNPAIGIRYDHFMKTREEFLASHSGWKPGACDRLTSVIWPENYGAARILYRLGLFKGSDKGFELSRQPRRDEAAVMLTRFLGLEEEALAAQGTALPFDDVSTFYRPYIALLYERGLTTGTSAEGRTYTPGSAVTAQQYMTFMLRGLGYSDADGDFVWSAALEKAVELGILSANEMAYVKGHAFDRGMMAYLSVKTLSARTASGKPLYEELADKGVFSRALADEVL